ncbi:uncharacterized protein si:dkey-30e9.6 [Megalops cyprinoides]|uniref:uncharacterized protein si:dkey-30e9.6 n=1 Tax=Megalops cyprinoides TaxID=118141 RepID=UPI001863F291|nr:uncharacterized protein si:dkey-30e9.6 [Megalops cyprinoides]
MMDSDKYLESPNSMCFEKKTVFSAGQDLASIRSKGFVHPETIHDTDVWEWKAPDFSPKLYTSLCLPWKKSENRRPALFVSNSRETLHGLNRVSQIVLPEIHPRKEQPFTLRYRPPDALEAKLTFVRTGKYPSLTYTDPKPHDFRQYADDIPEMVFTLEKDPGNLNFKSRHLSTIGGIRSLGNVQQRASMRRFDTFKPAEPKWDTQLILPKRPWPPKSASYTRHRRRRGVHSALMDRVEEKLTISWKNG